MADDDEWMRHLLRSYLASEGVEVETARTGEEAAERFLALRPDIVFLDVEMPGRSGLDVLALIREQTVETAVVITTAFGTDRIMATALRCGADDYLRKPFEKTDLQAVLDRTIARLLLTRQNAALRARIEEDRRRLEMELAQAAQTLSEMMPAGPPVAGVDVAAACLSAHEVGGDFYDWQRLPSGDLGLTVGDVMGKGLGAALLMASTRAVVRTLVAEHGPGALVARAAAALEDDLGRLGAFVTLFHAKVSIATGQVRYVDAGHGYAFILRADGQVEDLAASSLPMGVEAGEAYVEGMLALGPGDTLVVYSDGLAEARPELFAARDGVAACIRRAPDANAVLRCLLAEVEQVKPLPDDLTVVVVRRQPVAAAV